MLFTKIIKLLDTTAIPCIEVLISTMNRNSLGFLDAMFPNQNLSNLNILIVNQTDNQGFLTSKIPSIRVLNVEERGLSKSRNLAIQNSIGEILIIADDDVVYEFDFLQTIQKAHIENANASMIAFCVKNEKGVLFKKYSRTTKKHLNYFDIYNIMSIEITLNKSNFDFKNIKFDENFGLGSIFPLGEEQIFLCDLKKQKKELIFVPKVFVMHDSQTSIDKGTVEKNYFSFGAFYFRNHQKMFIKWILLKLLFDLKQGKINLNHIYLAFKSSLKGRKALLECK